MAGYFTDKKTTDWWRPIYKDGVLQNPNGGLTVSQLSSVYSYRSGRRALRSQNSQEILLSASESSSESRQGNSFDNGHEFASKKQKFSCNYPDILIGGTSGHYFRGPLLGFTNTTIPSGLRSFAVPPASNTTYYGGAAIASTRPTKPRADISQFLGEINRLPQFFIKGNAFRDYVDVARFAGGQYLNVSFGWMPFISDLKKYVTALMNLQVQYDQFMRDNGRVVRRRLEFPPIVSTTTPMQPTLDSSSLNYIALADSFGANFYANGGNGIGYVSVTEKRTETYKFSGAYTYCLDPSGILSDKPETHVQLARKLLGLDLTPSLLWELAPWSWLSDWHTNIGIALSNYSAFQKDGLVLRYGYLQRETVVERIQSVAGLRFSFFNPGTITNTFTTVWKERFRASPYGFALNPSNYTPFQWAILAALGMTKAPGVLRRY
jgi:hypothetical protein